MKMFKLESSENFQSGVYQEVLSLVSCVLVYVLGFFFLFFISIHEKIVNNVV